MTKIELTTRYGKASIEVEEDDLNIDHLFEHLIEPLLLASGYHPNTIEGLFDNAYRKE